jgi:putative DNA primase/helicase
MSAADERTLAYPPKRTLRAAEIAHALGGTKRTGNGWLAKCPAHEDRKASLSLRDGEWRLLAFCFAGCDWPRIRDALTARGLL